MLQKYIEFSSLSALILISILCFLPSSINYYTSFSIILPIFFLFLILLTGILKNYPTDYFQKDNFLFCSPKSICTIDILFLLDFIYNVFSIFYSQQVRASIEECVYQTAYFIIYILFRFLFSGKNNLLNQTFKSLYLLYFCFICSLGYKALYELSQITTDGRIVYNSLHPNVIASLLFVFSSVIIYFLFLHIKRKEKLYSIINILALIINAFFIVLTSSRGGMIGFFVAACCILFLAIKQSGHKINFKFLILIFALILTTIYFILPNHFERILTLFEKQNWMSAGERIQIWNYCFNLFLQNPILGVGASVCSYSVKQFGNYSMIDAHNFLLQKLCDLGIIGTLIYLLPLFFIVIKLYKYITKNEQINTENNALCFSTLFLLISLFTNSSFSPHYILPLLSMLLYIFFAAIVSRLYSTDNTGYESASKINQNYFFYFFFTFFIFSLIILNIKNILLPWLSSDITAIFSDWIIQIIVIVLTFKVFILTPNIQTATNLKLQLKFNYSSTWLISLILLIFLCIFTYGMHFYIAEKANDTAIKYTFSFSSKNAHKYFDIAIKNDPNNMAYILNKSFLIFIVELIKGNNFKNNPKIKESINLLIKCSEKYIYDDLSKYNLALLESKYYGYKNTNETLIQQALNINEYQYETALNNSNFIFSKLSERYNKNAINILENFNDKIISKINIVMNEEIDYSKKGQLLSPYLNFLTMSFRTARNLDIPNAEALLSSGVKSAIDSADYAAKYIPFSNYSQKSIQYTQQFEILSTVAFVMPVIWKFGQKINHENSRKKYYKYFGQNNSLFYIVQHFLYNEKFEIEIFKKDSALYNYLINLNYFSEKKYVEAINNREVVFQSDHRKQNAILYSWIYYKNGDILTARELILYSQMGTLTPFKRDFIFKRKLLFDGNFFPFYYIPLQTYFNEFIMLALIKMHNGDHTMVLREIFDYLNTVVYNQ